MHRNKHRKSSRTGRQRNIIQKKEQEKILRKKNEMKWRYSNISDKEYKVLIIKMLTAQERREEEGSKTLNKDIENRDRGRWQRKTMLGSPHVLLII